MGRKCITKDVAKIVVHSLITSRFDYRNPILYGLPNCDLDKQLYNVRKLATTLITGTRKYDHITPVLERFHRLLVRKTIECKFLLLWRKIMATHAYAACSP